jgi:hypothetical protein
VNYQEIVDPTRCIEMLVCLCLLIVHESGPPLNLFQCKAIEDLSISKPDIKMHIPSVSNHFAKLRLLTCLDIDTEAVEFR